MTGSVSAQIANAVTNNPAVLVLSVAHTADGAVVTFTSTSVTSAAAPDPASADEKGNTEGAGVVVLIVILVLIVVGLIVLVVRHGRKKILVAPEGRFRLRPLARVYRYFRRC